MESQGFTSVSVPEDGRESVHAASGGRTDLQFSRSAQWAQALVFAILFSFPALLCLRMAVVSDPDVWWHLRSGEWILQHHAVPRTDPFSSYGAGKPWTAYGWLFELLVLKFFQRLGLVGIVVYTTGMVLAITVALHRLIRRLQTDFSFAVLLTAFAGFSLVPLYTPRPWLFTILFFVLETDILMQARRSGKARELFLLPVLFGLWSNLHIQFVAGLLVLAIALAEAVLAQRWTSIQTRIRPRWMCGIFAACILATLANPYGWKIYGIVYDLVAQHGVLSKVSELSALPFRTFGDWCVLLLALSAVAVLARAHSFEFFESVLLAFAVFASFRSQRDIWLLVVAASAILAAGWKGDKENRFRGRASAAVFVAAATVLALLLGFRLMNVNNSRLGADLAKEMPVRAVEVVKEKGWSGPLYNDYSWGGYLIWALRLPVSMDGRQNVYGDERIDLSVATWSGHPDWASDPDLAKAGLVMGPVKAPLIQLLRMDPRFELAYEDKLAAVFVARKAQSSGPAGVAAASAATPAHPPCK
jgi:hypothetical protein